MNNRSKITKYLGFIYVNSYFFIRSLLGLNFFLLVIFILLRYTNYKELSTQKFLEIHFKYFEAEYFIRCFFIAFSIVFFLWALVPYWLTNFNPIIKSRKLYIYKNNSSSSRRYFIFIILTILLCFLIFLVSFDIISFFSSYGLSSDLTSIFGSLIMWVSVFCSIYSVLPKSPKHVRNVEIIDFPEIRIEKNKTIYLNVGALAPRTKSVSESLIYWNELIEKYSPTSTLLSSIITGNDYSLLKKESKKIKKYIWRGSEELRTQLSNLTGLEESQRLVFLTNTSRGIEIALESLKPKTILTTDHEHESQKQFFSVMKRRHSTDVVDVPVINKSNSKVANYENDFIKRYINECKSYLSYLKDDEVFVAFLSHVCSSTGWILPINRICEELKKIDRKVFIVIDGAHSVGNLPKVSISSIDCDYYIFCGHKWLYGAPSLGVLVLNKNYTEQAQSLVDEVHEYLAFSPRLNIENPQKCHSTINLDSLISLSVSIENFLDLYNDEYIIKNLKTIKRTFINFLEKNSNFFISNETYLEVSPGILNISFKNKSFNNQEEIENLRKFLEENFIITKHVYSPALGDTLRLCIPFFLRYEEIKTTVDILNRYKRIPKKV